LTAYYLSKHPPLLLNLLFKEPKTPAFTAQGTAYYTRSVRFGKDLKN